MANRLPVPLMNVINGGAHADNQLDIREFMLVPYAADSRESLHGNRGFPCIEGVLKRKGWREALELKEGSLRISGPMRTHCNCASMQLKSGIPGREKKLPALDVASSELYKDGKYHLEAEGRALSNEEFAAPSPILQHGSQSSASRMGCKRTTGTAGKS